MGAGTEAGLATALRWVWDGGLAGVLLSAVAFAAVVLALRVWASSRHGGSEAAGEAEAIAAARVGLVDARQPWPEWWDPHKWHVGGVTDVTCGQCTAMSLTDYLQFMPDKGEPGYTWPRDVMDDITGMQRTSSINEPFGTVEIRLRGGEVIRMQPGKDDPASIVKAVRQVRAMREEALVKAGEITDPVGASIALEMLYMAAGWATPQRTDCPCCKVFALEGCILPPGADLDGEAGRCTYTDDCRCWGGAREDEPGERWCEDCRADWYDGR